jgi:tetratricopeptide (TPR) repeat protein
VVLGIHAIDGMAGIGKTTFAVHAAHELAGSFPDGQFFLPLHAHSPGQRPVGPADALASLLLTAGVAAQHIPPGLEARAAQWRDHVADKKILLLLDDAAGHEQVRPLLPGTAGSLVLITSRRRLAALEDAAQISLDILPPDDAAALLARLAARPGMGAGDPAVGEITRLCGYLPLAIGMLASQLRNHPARTEADLAAELAAARDRLALMHAENVSVGAAFGLSYTDLTPGPQRLFRRLGLVPGPSIDAYAAAALDCTTLTVARRHLDELYDQHLLAEPAPGRYQLHDLLREHARSLAAADDPAESDSAVARLLDYYLHAARGAGQYFTPWTSAYRRPPPGLPPAEAPDLSTLEQAGAWLEADRANLHAAADCAADRACFPHAFALPVAMSGFLAARGHWDQSAALHRTALAAARRAGDRLGEADTLAELGVVQRETGDYPAATASLARALALYGDAGDLAARTRPRRNGRPPARPAAGARQTAPRARATARRCSPEPRQRTWRHPRQRPGRSPPRTVRATIATTRQPPPGTAHTPTRSPSPGCSRSLPSHCPYLAPQHPRTSKTTLQRPRSNSNKTRYTRSPRRHRERRSTACNPSDGDDDLAAGAAFLDVPDGCRGLAERVGPVDGGCDLPGLEEIAEDR